MTTQEMLRAAMPEEDRVRLDIARNKALAAHVRKVMAAELLDGFADDAFDMVPLYDEYGPFDASVPRAVAIALGAEMRGDWAYLKLGVLPQLTVVATHPGYLLTGCMDGAVKDSRAADAVLRWIDEKGRAVRDAMADYGAEEAWEIAKKGAEQALRPSLPPTHAERVEVANAYYRKGLRAGVMFERARLETAFWQCFSGVHSVGTKEAVAHFHRHLAQDVDATVEEAER